MGKWRKRPVTVEAVQWLRHGDHPEVKRYPDSSPVINKALCCCKRITADHGWVSTLEGGHIVCPKDWIIRGVAGEYYPCKPDIFRATYEPEE